MNRQSVRENSLIENRNGEFFLICTPSGCIDAKKQIYQPAKYPRPPLIAFPFLLDLLWVQEVGPLTLQNALKLQDDIEGAEQ
jgi:hypothetical protein